MACWHSVCVFSAAACFRLHRAGCARQDLPTQICAASLLIFLTVCFHKNCPRQIRSSPPGKLLMCAMILALLLFWEFICWYLSSPASALSVLVRPVKETLLYPYVNELVWYSLKNLWPWKTNQSVKLYFFDWLLQFYRELEDFSWLMWCWSCLSFSFWYGWQKLVNSSLCEVVSEQSVSLNLLCFSVQLHYILRTFVNTS